MTKNHLLHLLFSISILMLFTQYCLAQSITWQRTYQSTINVHDYGYEICPAPGGNFYFAGYISSQPEMAYVLKINTLGDTLWSRSFSNLRAYCIANSLDSGCVITGDRTASPFAIKLDSQGNTVWEKYYNSANINNWEIKRTPDGGFIACGESVTSSQDGYVMKIDSQGNLQWQRLYAGGSAKGYYSVVVDNEGYILTGYKDLRPIADSTKIVITKIDSNGIITWEKEYAANKDSYGIKIKKTKDGYIIGGNSSFSTTNQKIFILKIDNTGNLITINIFPTVSSYPEFFDDIEAVNFNRYIITLRQDSLENNNNKTYAKVLIIDSNMEVINFKKFPSYRFASFTSVLPLNNGDILFGGSFEYFTYWPNHGVDFYAVRTDSLLNVPPLPPIGIIKNSNIYPDEFKINQNFPNPFNPITQITFEIPVNSHVIIKVYNLLGQEIIKLVDNHINRGIYTISFDGTSFSSGIYLCTLFAGGHRLTRKLILQK